LGQRHGEKVRIHTTDGSYLVNLGMGPAGAGGGRFRDSVSTHARARAPAAPPECADAVQYAVDLSVQEENKKRSEPLSADEAAAEKLAYVICLGPPREKVAMGGGPAALTRNLF